MSALADAIKKVATGPHLSKDLTQQESYQAMLEILSAEADPVRAAIFFIGLRMKRETNEENLGILQAIQQQTHQHQADVDNLMILSDPYNGFNRHCPLSAFLPSILAACGLPAISQGVLEMGPKFGVTHAQVLQLAGGDTNQTVATAAGRVNDPDIGWAYIDQSQATPGLYALQDLRTRMIKRPSLATLEKMIMPLKARNHTHLQIGFVHKAYPEVLAWLADKAGYKSALIVRGLEGGVVPTLREPSNNFIMHNGKLTDCALDPRAFGIEQNTRGVKAEHEQLVTAQETLEQGMKALDGENGPALDSLVLGAAMALWHVGIQPSQQQAADFVREVIISGRAKAQFERGLK